MTTVPGARESGETGFRASRRPGSPMLLRLAIMIGMPLAAMPMTAPVFAESNATGDAAAGEVAFARRCANCHMVVNESGETLAGRRNKTGPNLYGIAMHELAMVPDFRYSASMVAAGETDLVWTEENFVGYVMDPTRWLRAALDDSGARSKMTFKLRKEDDARNIFAYLAALDPEFSIDSASEDIPKPAMETEQVPVAIQVSYASDQAVRGEKRYKKDCLECHGDDLKGGLNGGAPLRGLAFGKKYFDTMPASVMFEYMSATMPPNAPGRYSENTYAELMAYILKRNGFRAGAPLPTDLDALDRMTIEK